MKAITAEEVLSIHWELVEMFRNQGDPINPPGPRDEGLLRSAAERPNTSLGTAEKYASVDAKAAALFHSLVMNHPFHNGNKRTALVALLIFFERNDRRVTCTDDDLFAFVLAVASRDAGFDGTADETVDAMERWLASNSVAERAQPSNMRIVDFLGACEQAGATYRKSSRGQGWLVIGPNRKSVKIAGSTKQLNGPVVRKYLGILGLAPVATGVPIDEFQNGLSPNQRVMRQYRAVLRRLAHA
jgi:death on curing protein